MKILQTRATDAICRMIENGVAEEKEPWKTPVPEPFRREDIIIRAQDFFGLANFDQE